MKSLLQTLAAVSYSALIAALVCISFEELYFLLFSVKIAFAILLFVVFCGVWFAVGTFVVFFILQPYRWIVSGNRLTCIMSIIAILVMSFRFLSLMIESLPIVFKFANLIEGGKVFYSFLVVTSSVLLLLKIVLGILEINSEKKQ